MYNNKRSEVLLNCYHVLYFRDSILPKIGQRLWCFKCAAARTVIKRPTLRKRLGENYNSQNKLRDN